MTKELTAFQKIWTNCRAFLEINTDGAADDWHHAEWLARRIATTLGLPFDFDTDDGEAIEQVILAGLKDERTFEQAVEAYESFISAQTLTQALILLCTEMGHEIVTDSDGDQYCKYCRVIASEAGSSDIEEIWEEDEGDHSHRLRLMPQPPHPLAE